MHHFIFPLSWLEFTSEAIEEVVSIAIVHPDYKDLQPDQLLAIVHFLGGGGGEMYLFCLHSYRQ